MKKVALGNSGVEVSALCLGALGFGSKNEKNLSYELLDQYVEAGGSFIDTANIYSFWIPGFRGGESETLLGQWIRDRGNRDDVFIAGKVGFAYQGVPRGLTAKLIEQECDKSLKRLGVDTIDLYYSHVDDRNTPLEETMQAYDKLVRAGKVRLIGASNFRAWRIMEANAVSRANGLVEYCCVQQRHTYARPRAGQNFEPQVSSNDDLLDYCKSTGTTLLAYSALLGGAYLGAKFPKQYAGADCDARVAVLRRVAEETDATVNQVILAWMLQSETPTIPLVAASAKERLAENLGALELSLAPEQMTALNDA